MIDWLTVVIALVIITSLVGIFGYFAWKISESDTFLFGGPTPDSVDSPVLEKKKGHDQTKKKRKEQKKPKRETKDGEAKQQNQSEETDEESEQVKLRRKIFFFVERRLFCRLGFLVDATDERS